VGRTDDVLGNSSVVPFLLSPSAQLDQALCLLLCKLDDRRSQKRYRAQKLTIAFSVILQLHHQISGLFGTPLRVNILAVGHLDLPVRGIEHSPDATPRDRSLSIGNVRLW
jgi:hypothetical protein